MAQRDREAERLARLLPHDLLLRLAYVPYVVARIVWDYAETLHTTAAYMKIQHTKPLCRELRELRRQYDRTYGTHIDTAHVQAEQLNSALVEDGIEHITRQLLVNLDADIRRSAPALDESRRQFVAAVQQCHILLSALLLYTRHQTQKAEEFLGSQMGHILPEPVYLLERLVPKFSEIWYNADGPFAVLKHRYIYTLANQFALMELMSENY